MAFNVREGIWGLEHLRLLLCRKLFNMKADAFMARYQDKGSKVEVLLDQYGNPALCSRCGFVKLKAVFDSGWQMEMCSALPLVRLENPVFGKWQSSLAGNGSELISGTPDKTEKQGEAILQDR